jgi:hypothetical protein
MSSIDKKIMEFLESFELVYDKENDKSYLQEKMTYGKAVCRQIGHPDTNAVILDLIYKKTEVFINDKEKKDINNLLNYKAKNSENISVVYKRFADGTNRVFVYLGKGKILYIGKNSIKEIKTNNIFFSELKNIKPIDEYDIENGDIQLLKKHINVRVDEFKLIVAFMVNAMFQNKPQLILSINGPSGISKSTISERIKTIVDPSLITLQNQPHDAKDLIASAENSYLLCFNNMSEITPKIQNIFCTISTGGVNADRAMYTNNKQSIVITKNPIIINGISNPLTQDDALNRAIIIRPQAIAKEQRKTEAEINSDFGEDLAKIRGGLYNLVRKILAIQEDFERPTSLNRMADFHLLGCMLEQVSEWKEGSFTVAYDRNLSLARKMIIEESEIAIALVEICEQGKFKGTYKDLLEKLGEIIHCKISARALSNQLDRLSDSLLSVHGIRIIKNGHSKNGNTLTIEKEDSPLFSV